MRRRAAGRVRGPPRYVRAGRLQAASGARSGAWLDRVGPPLHGFAA